MIKTGCEVTGIPAGYPIPEDTIHDGHNGVSLSQTINGLTSGSNLFIRILGRRLFYISPGNEGLFAVDVGFGNIMLRNPDTSFPWSGIDSIGTRYVIVFAADSSSHTIKFTGWGYYDSYLKGPEVILDDVRLFASTEGSNPCITEINDLSQNAVATVFPNPATNQIEIKGNDILSLALYDVLGRVVFSNSEIIAPLTINTTSFSRGIYFLQARTKGGMVARKVILSEP